MQAYRILWADDEIDLLKPHIMFLHKKGYEITPVNSGSDALDLCEKEEFDLIFLDENMPGMSGLETLTQIKATKPNIPVVMITKSEEEHIMEEAIGARIADYLIKPINPNQILLSIKKILDNKRILSEKTNSNYQQDFRNISMAFTDDLDHEQWADIYKKLVYWELEIANTENRSMEDVLLMQKDEANTHFAKYIERNYVSWLNDADADRPLLSQQLMRQKVFPMVKESDVPVYFVLIDNLRYDQWKAIAPIISEYFVITDESTYYSILPTTTAYARNAIFAGLMPSEIQKNFPEYWVEDLEDGGKNLYEEELLRAQCRRHRLEDMKVSYNKILNATQGKALLDNIHNLKHNQLNVLVYNFVDMLSHARTDTEMIRELAPDETAYRSITKSWLLHSPLLETLKKIAEMKGKLIITTDHGTIRTQKPYKIIGDKNTNANLRYKHGKNLSFEKKNVFVAHNPEEFKLPKNNVSSKYVFTTEDYFFAYPNNYNHYVKYYKNTFQHGGISLEEIIIPYVELRPK